MNEFNVFYRKLVLAVKIRVVFVLMMIFYNIYDYAIAHPVYQSLIRSKLFSRFLNKILTFHKGVILKKKNHITNMFSLKNSF